MELGVRYALAGDGSVADPATAPRLEYTYRCFDCGEHVHTCRALYLRDAHEIPAGLEHALAFYPNRLGRNWLELSCFLSARDRAVGLRSPPE